VNTATARCGCGRYQQDGVPCSHAIAFIHSQGEGLERYLPASLTIANWAASFEAVLSPIDISGLRPTYNNLEDDDADAVGICNPPFTRVPRGRPRKKRLDKANYRTSRGIGLVDVQPGALDALERRTVHCSTCGEEGHYATTCKVPHN
jgi:SWIM zinc finger